MSFNVGGWSETIASSSAASAARAASTGKQHVIYGVYASYSGTVTPKLLTIKATTADTEVFRAFVSTPYRATFPKGISIVPGSSVTLELAASTSITITNTVTLHGITR